MSSSKFKNLFTGRTTASNNIGHSYENSIESAPPIQGTYPVAGNGPNVLEELQRRMARTSSVASARQLTVVRPTSAPSNNGRLRKRSPSAAINRERTPSGFSTKTLPSFSDSSRHANRSEPPPPLPAFPQKSAVRRLGICQPERSPERLVDEKDMLIPPYARTQTGSPSRYIDVLDAQSNIRASRLIPQHRTEASGSRNYGDEVADRNIAPRVSSRESGRDITRDSRLDIDAPDLDYLKTVYRKRRDLVTGTDSRAASALGHVLGHESVGSDDIEPQATSTTLPLRSTSLIPHTISPSGVTHDADRLPRANGVGQLRHQRESSSPDTSTASYTGDPLQASPTATMPFLAALKHPATSLRSLRAMKEPPPVDPPRLTASTVHEDTARDPVAKSTTIPSSTTIARSEDPNLASASTSPGMQGNKGTGSNTREASNASVRPDSVERDAPPAMSYNTGKLVDGAEKLGDLRGVVDLTNTVDTDVTTKTLPAVTHEHVTREQTEIVQVVITREIHYHDIYHRVLPVIETEILPTKHYMPSEDGRGLVEVSTDLIANYQPSWEIVPKAGRQSTFSSNPKDASHTESPPTGPVHDASQHRKTTSIPQAAPSATPTADGPPTSSSVDGSHSKSSSIAHSNLEPILTSKKTYMTPGGYPRTEYYWRHPPVFEDAMGRTQPIYVKGLLNNELNTAFTADARDESGGALAEPKIRESENRPLFRDSGYEANSSPDLTDKSSMSGPGHTNTAGIRGNSSDITEQERLARIERELDAAEAASRRPGSTGEERAALGTKLQAIEQEMSRIKI